MKSVTKLLVVALAFGATTLSAQDCCIEPIACDPCGSICCDYDFSVYGELLYWDICAVSDNQSGIQQNVREYGSDYQSGYRVGAAIQTACWQLAARYASVDSTKSFSDEFVFPGNVTSKRTFDYSVLDINIGRSIALQRICGTVTPFVGVKLAWIKERKDVTAFETVAYRFQLSNKFDGYGLNIGAAFDAKLWERCLPTSFVAKLSCAFVKGSFTGDFKQMAGTKPFSPTIFQDICSLVFVPELYVGLNFALFECDCFTSDLSIGYEAQLWTQYLLTLNNDITHSTRREGALAVDGLVVRLAVGF